MNDDLVSQPGSDSAAVLDRALGLALGPPPLPLGFREEVMAAVRVDASRQLALRRTRLEAEYDWGKSQFSRDYAWLRRRSVVFGVAIASLAAAASMALVPWLRTASGELAPWVPLLALATSVLIATFDVAMSCDLRPGPR